MINEIYVNNIKLTSVENLPIRNNIWRVDIICYLCGKKKTLKIFRKSFLDMQYKCISCIKTGKNNPFYGKHHTETSKQKIGGAVNDYKGSKNPFYGNHHTTDTITKLKNNIRCFHVGEDNPFYGKTHTEETINVIKDKNKLYRQINYNKILETQLKNLGYSKNDFMEMLESYANLPHNRNSISKKYDIDFRTMQSYWIYFGIINKQDLKLLKLYKKLYSNPSKPETELYELLKNEYGELNVKHDYEMDGYHYDICLFNKLIVEYDGYYWHKIVKNKNDEIKNNIAKNNNHFIYRVEEDENRYVDIDKALINIKSLLIEDGLVE